MVDSFDESLRLAAASMGLLPGAESVTYFPRSGASRRIQAIVTRPEAEQLAGLDGGNRPLVEVLVRNDGTKGISPDEVDTGGDRLQLAIRTDNCPVYVRITEIINQDAGFLLLRTG